VIGPTPEGAQTDILRYFTQFSFIYKWSLLLMAAISDGCYLVAISAK